MNTVRPPAVAGQFYPSDSETLLRTITGFLETLPDTPRGNRPPKALAVPHAGYVYSGPVAASAYKLLQQWSSDISRVVLLGPSHRVYLRGAALSGSKGFSTPLGTVPVDRKAEALLAGLPQVTVSDEAHALEHSLEVQLPFLQIVLGAFEIVPLVVGEIPPKETAEILERLWGGEETLILVSTDLSHYLTYGAAVTADRKTARTIIGLGGFLDPRQACGAAPLNGLLEVARRRRLGVRQLALANSGDTAGDRSRVVGYGAFAFFEEPENDR